MKFFIFNGITAQPLESGPVLGGNDTLTRKSRKAYWLKSGLPLPKEGENLIFPVPGMGRISIFVHDIFDTLLLIAASSQEKAYALAIPFRAYFVIFHEYLFNDRHFDTLIELREKPRPIQTRRQILELNKPHSNYGIDLDFLESEIFSSQYLSRGHIGEACKFVRAVLHNRALAESVIHLEQSYAISEMMMNGSYYHFHYRHDRLLETKYSMRKKYLENRTRYDMSFLSAFRALEAILGTERLKKREIQRKLHDFDYNFQTSFSKNRWRSYHVLFTRKRKWWKLEDLISYFLVLRNAVAAHANIRPPKMLCEDQVLEIQKLVGEMLFAAFSSVKNGSRSK